MPIVLPFNDTISVLLGDHEKGVGLAVGGAVGAEVVDAEAVNHPGERLLVVDVQLDTVRHVLGYAGVPE